MIRASRIHTILPLLALLEASSLHGRPRREMEMEVIRYFPTEKAMLVESLLEIPLQEMKYEKKSPDRCGYRLAISVDLYDSRKERLLHDEWERTGEVEEKLISSERAYIVEPILSVPVDIGGYELQVSVRDQISGNVQEFRREIADPGKSPILSDIALANSIVADTATAGNAPDIFRKGSLRINYNSSGNFYGSSPLVYFYYQIRNDSAESRQFEVQMDILDATGGVVKSLPSRNLLVNPGLQADAGAFSCSGLPVSGYYLRIRTGGGSAEGADSPTVATKSFTVAVREEEAAPKESQRSVVRNEFAGFSETQLDSAFSMMRYFLSTNQKKEYKELNIQGKRNYLHQVWKTIDPVPATEENELRDQLSDRISYALEEFSTIWKVKRGDESEWAVDDRGVIYIKYGAPDERLIRPNEYGSNPYEIWKYYSSGYSYLFLERIRTQGHELIFTNNRDESYQPNWERYFPTLTLQDIYRELGSAVNR